MYSKHRMLEYRVVAGPPRNGLLILLVDPALTSENASG
jgi:hypothetical protein